MGAAIGKFANTVGIALRDVLGTAKFHQRPEIIADDLAIEHAAGTVEDAGEGIGIVNHGVSPTELEWCRLTRHRDDGAGARLSCGEVHR